MTRLRFQNSSYDAGVENADFYAPTLVNGDLYMSVLLLARLVLGTVHPPRATTGSAAAMEKDVILFSWHSLPVLGLSTTTILGWTKIANNLRRRQYLIHWWSLETTLVRNAFEILNSRS